MTPAPHAILAIVAACACSAAGPGSQPPAQASGGAPAIAIALRGSDAVISGELVNVSSGGVKLRSPGGNVTWYGWDVVRADAEPALKPYAELSESALRAKKRVERGDLAMAEREFGRLAELLGERWPVPGPTGSLAAEGLVRCRLARGWRIGATWSWLAWLGCRADSGSWIGGSFRGDAAMDVATGLCPQLPPIFSSKLEGDAIRASSDAPEWTRLCAAGGVPGELAGYYRAAMAYESSKSGGEAEALAKLTPSEPGEQLVADVVLSRIGDTDVRRAARDRLTRRIDAIEGLGTSVRTSPETADAILPAMSDSPRELLSARWVEAWCRAAIGRSLIMETDLGQRRKGVLELLHLPARFGDILPGLAALCLIDAAAELEAMGDPQAASRLRADLDSRFLNAGHMPGAAAESPGARAPSKGTTKEKRSR